MSFSFGSPSSAPANSSLSSGFSFGANKPATPGFGLTGASQQATGLFGTPATSAPAFGTTTPAFGSTPGFGQSSTPSFGAAATPGFAATSSAPAFGTAAPAFGSSTTPAFGATATSTAPAFGATSTAPAFGALSATPAFGATSTAPTFGATSAAPTFGATSAAPAFGATSTAPTFGAPSTLPTLGATSAAPAFGLSLAPATTASGGLGGFGFGASTQGGTGGLFGTSTTTSTGLFGAKVGTATVTGTLPSTSAAPSLGLGGVAPTSTSATGGDKSEPPKQSKLPNEILTTVDSFKQFVKKQKSLSSEIMRVSIKPLHKVSRSCETTLAAVGAVRSELARARVCARRLRAAAAAATAAADQHTTEPESTAPPAYVKELISELEQQLIAFKVQMEVADKQMRATPKLLTDQELTLGIRRMHEAGVALAGRLQAAHAQVQCARDQYLNLRKYVLKDHSNVFEAADANSSLDMIVGDESARKKSKSGRAVLTDPRAALGSIQQLAGPSPFTYIAGTISPFPTNDASASSWVSQPALGSSFAASGGAVPAPETSSFQLQKPPGKRGKQ